MKKLRIEVPEDCIEMPVQEVRGPMPSDEGKEFLVHIKVTISYTVYHLLGGRGFVCFGLGLCTLAG